MMLSTTLILILLTSSISSPYPHPRLTYCLLTTHDHRLLLLHLLLQCTVIMSTTQPNLSSLRRRCQTCNSFRIQPPPPGSFSSSDTRCYLVTRLQQPVLIGQALRG